MLGIRKSRVKDGRRRKKRSGEHSNVEGGGEEKGKQGIRQETWPKKEGDAVRREGERQGKSI